MRDAFVESLLTRQLILQFGGPDISIFSSLTLPWGPSSFFQYFKHTPPFLGTGKVAMRATLYKRREMQRLHAQGHASFTVACPEQRRAGWLDG